MKKIVLAAAVSAALSPAAFAADPMTIVITASRTEQAAADVTAPVTVITKEDIEQQQPKSVAEAVAMTPGLQMTSNGGYGQASTLYLRGLNQERMLVLVDGAPIGSATNGQASLQHIPVDHIERIEIVRGARSSLYGSSAIAGVIQIFTKKQTKEQRYAEIETGFGSMATRQAAVKAGWGNGSTMISANVSRFETEGFDVMPDKASLGKDDDGFENDALKLDAEHSIGKHTLSAGLQYINGENESDNCGPYGGKGNDCISETTYTTFYTSLESHLTDNLTVDSKVSTYQDNLQRYELGEKQNKFVTDTLNLSVLGELSLSDGITAISGLDYKKDEVSGSGVDNFKENSRFNKALFFLLEKSTPNSQFSVSARVDDNEAFGKFTTFAFDNKVALTDQLSLTAGYATAFRAPTFNDMYWPDSGNTELDPETSGTATLGVDYAPNKTLSFELNAYQTNVEDMIAWAKQPSGNWIPDNVNSVQITGFEFGAQAKLGGTKIFFNTDIMNPKDTETDKVLTYRAQETANLRITQQISQLTLGLDTQYKGKRYTNTDNTDKLPSYTLYNLDAQYRLNEKLQLSASIKNLTDKEYVNKEDYATAGRTVFGSVRYRF